MKIFNPLFEIKKAKTEKSGAVDRLIMVYILIKKVFKTST